MEAYSRTNEVRALGRLDDLAVAFRDASAVVHLAGTLRPKRPNTHGQNGKPLLQRPAHLPAGTGDPHRPTEPSLDTHAAPCRSRHGPNTCASVIGRETFLAAASYWDVVENRGCLNSCPEVPVPNQQISRFHGNRPDSTHHSGDSPFRAASGYAELLEALKILQGM